MRSCTNPVPPILDDRRGCASGHRDIGNLSKERRIRDGFRYVAGQCIICCGNSDVSSEKGGQTREHAVLAKT